MRGVDDFVLAAAGDPYLRSCNLDRDRPEGNRFPVEGLRIAAGIPQERRAKPASAAAIITQRNFIASLQDVAERQSEVNLQGPTASQGLTEDEQAVIKLAGQFARDFAALPQLHPADIQEVAFHVHALARIVGMRAAHRAHPDVVPNRAGTPI